MKKLKVGFIAGFMEGFSKEKINLFTDYESELRKLSSELNFELISYKEIITQLDQAINIREDLDSKGVDFVLLFHPSYIMGTIVYEILKTRAQIGLWATDEPNEEGPLSSGAMVSLEQNAGMAIHNFLGNTKKFKWFFGDINGKYFKDRFRITIKSLGAVNNLKNLRVAQIGKLATGHFNHMINEREIYKNLGVDVLRDYEIEDIVELSEKIPEKEVEREMKSLKSSCAVKRIPEDKVFNSIRIYMGVKKICEENNYSAVALDCWSKLVPLKEMVGCLIISRLNSTGITAGCEADVLSTISMMILRLITGQVVALMDLPKFDYSDDSLLLWHCGSAPVEIANERGVILDRHYCWDAAAGVNNCGPVTDMIFKKGEVTVFRLVKESKHFYYFTGKIFNDGKKSYDGSRGWVNDLKFYEQSIKTIDLTNTLLVNGLPHHFPMVMGNAGKYIEEFAYWMDLKKIRRMDYRDYLYV